MTRFFCLQMVDLTWGVNKAISFANVAFKYPYVAFNRFQFNVDTQHLSLDLTGLLCTHWEGVAPFSRLIRASVEVKVQPEHSESTV